MSPFSIMAVAPLSLSARASSVPALSHPIGIPLAAFTIVVLFAAGFGVMVAVGHLRGRRKSR